MSECLSRGSFNIEIHIFKFVLTYAFCQSPVFTFYFGRSFQFKRNAYEEAKIKNLKIQNFTHIELSQKRSFPGERRHAEVLFLEFLCFNFFFYYNFQKFLRVKETNPNEKEFC